MPPKLDYTKINDCLKNYKMKTNTACKLLQSLRMRINSVNDEYVKFKVAKEYIDSDIDFKKLLHC